MDPVVSPHTLIFVDIDGVLNVGFRDRSLAPVLFNTQGCQYALSKQGREVSDPFDQECIEKTLLLLREEQCHASQTRFFSLACEVSQHCSDILVERLANIVAAAKGRLSVILASTWRKAKYTDRVRSLEQALSRRLGRRFAFDGCTELAEERFPGDRLRCVGDYLERQVDFRDGEAGLRVLVLDDLFISPLNGWGCDGHAIRSTTDAENYLAIRAPFSRVAVRLLHPYREWQTASGLRVHVGIGLTGEHCSQAAAFFEEEQIPCRPPSTVRETLAASESLKIPMKGAETGVAKLAHWAAQALRVRVKSGLETSFPLEYVAFAFLLGAALQALVVQA